MKLSDAINQKKGSNPLTLAQKSLLASSGFPKNVRDTWTYADMRKNEKLFKSQKFEFTPGQQHYLSAIMKLELDCDLSFADAELLIVPHLFEHEPDEIVEKYTLQRIAEREEKNQLRFLERQISATQPKPKEVHEDIYSAFRNLPTTPNDIF